MKKEKHNIEYLCGCIHEIKLSNGLWSATGKNKNCEDHKK